MLCIGYTGMEAFDVVLYISRTITKLNKRVLIIDLSNDGALMETINHGMELDSKEGIVNYRDLNYIRKIPNINELAEFQEGVVFVVYGDDYYDLKGTPINLDSIRIIVNVLPSDITNVSKRIKKIDVSETDTKILIRDVITHDDVERTIGRINQLLDSVSYDYLYYSVEDYENAVNCQVSKVVRFTSISRQMEKHIVNEVSGIFPDIAEKKIRKAVALAKKGV